MPTSPSTSLRPRADEEERLLDRFRDPADPLKLIIVTAKLLTGFDAPILQAMYLDKPLRDHTLLQAICRVNRTYSEQKTHGLIVDYLGIFDDVAQALEFDDKSVQAGGQQHPGTEGQAAGGDAEVPGLLCRRGSQRRGLRGPDRRAAVPAQQRGARQLRRRVQRARQDLGGDCRPTPSWAYEKDYKWLSQVYQSVQPSSGHGKLIWHSWAPRPSS
jgi:type I restriction enzyme R subunit